jgi:hypothetical protein
MRESDSETGCIMRRVNSCGCVPDTDVFFLDPDVRLLKKEKPGQVENSQSGFVSIVADRRGLFTGYHHSQESSFL